MIFKKVENPAPLIDYLSETIGAQLKLGREVLWLLSGGSSVPYQVEVARALKNQQLSGLTAALTDERHGPVGHPESNWQKLLDAGFELPGAKLYPILQGKDIGETANDFANFIAVQLTTPSYKLACIGIGADGHCLGVLCNSEVVHAKDQVIAYQGADFPRITMSLDSLKLLDEGVAYMVGEPKHPILNQLANEALSLERQPAQALKKIKKMTVYNDYIGEPL